MLDFIFLIGTSGVGKSTLAKRLMETLQSTCIEQHMVPEFLTRDGVEAMTGEMEETTCYEVTRAMALCFQKLGYRNIIVTDLDDLRTREIPMAFRGFRYLTLKLICTDPAELQSRMAGRENGLVDYELQRKLSEKMLSRPLMVNEQLLDTTGLDEEQVLQKALEILESFKPETEYEYHLPPREWFYSWVPSRGLR